MEYHEYNYNQEFRFETGDVIPRLKIAFHISDSPYADSITVSGKEDWKSVIAGRKVVWICHALTANSDAEEWWPGIVGRGKFIDPDKYFIVCVNMLGSCYGTSGPSETKPDVKRPYLLDFPKVTIRDIVNVNKIVRDLLGVGKIDFLIGSSIGGFQAVEWLAGEPDAASKALLMATAARVSPWLSAWEETQRMALEADPTFRNPDFLLQRDGEQTVQNDSELQSDMDCCRKLLRGGEKGLMAARAIAMLSYRSAQGYNATQAEPSDDALFAGRAASYQRHQGKKLSDRFDAYSYYSLACSLDSHNVGRGRGGVKAALAGIKAKVTVVGINSDGCFPPEEVRGMAEAIPGADYFEITSAFGHDGFLLENDQIEKILHYAFDDC